MSKNMTLVTGATGFVGSHLVKRLASSGRPVRALVRNLEKARKLFGGSEGALLPNIDLAQGDVSDRESLIRAAQGCEAVVHLVGIIQPAPGQSFLSIHVEGTRNVLDAALRRGR